jgi:trk system potassium uptake protein TrkA
VKISIIGAGDVGFHLAKVLSTEGHHVTVIDKDAAKLLRIEDLLDVRVILGSGSSVPDLERASVPTADILFAVSNVDEVNMLAGYFGKCLGAKKTIIRVKEYAQLRGRKDFYRKVLQPDLMICSDDLSAMEISYLVRDHRAVAVEDFAEGIVQVRRAKVSPEFPIVGKPLADVDLPEGCLIAAIFREDGIIIPGGTDTVESEDEILLIGKREGVENFENAVGGFKVEARNVTLYGGGNMVREVAQALTRVKVKIKVISSDPNETKDLAEKLQGATVVAGDATDVALLREERIANTDVFVAISSVDEKNLLACQMAKALGAKRTLSLVQRPDYAPFAKALAVDAVVIPRLLIANHILNFVRRGELSSIAIIEEGKAEIIETVIHSESKLVDKSLAEAGLPKGTVVGAVVREGETVVPKGAFKFKAYDTLVVFTTIQALPSLEKLFPPMN